MDAIANACEDKETWVFFTFSGSFLFFRFRFVLSVWPPCLKKLNSLCPAFPGCLIFKVTEAFGMAPKLSRFSFKIEQSSSQGTVAQKVSKHSACEY